MAPEDTEEVRYLLFFLWAGLAQASLALDIPVSSAPANPESSFSGIAFPNSTQNLDSLVQDIRQVDAQPGSLPTGLLDYEKAVFLLGGSPAVLSASASLESANWDSVATGTLPVMVNSDDRGGLRNFGAGTERQVEQEPMSSAPEPGTMAMMGAGMLVLGAVLRRGRRQRSEIQRQPR